MHPLTLAIDRVKAGMGIPGLVKMQPVDAFAQQLLDPRDVMAKAGIGRIGAAGMAGRVPGLSL